MDSVKHQGVAPTASFLPSYMLPVGYPPASASLDKVPLSQPWRTHPGCPPLSKAFSLPQRHRKALERFVPSLTAFLHLSGGQAPEIAQEGGTPQSFALSHGACRSSRVPEPGHNPTPCLGRRLGWKGRENSHRDGELTTSPPLEKLRFNEILRGFVSEGPPAQPGLHPAGGRATAPRCASKWERWQSLVTRLSCSGLFALLELWLLTTFSGFLCCCYFGRSGTGRKRNLEAPSPAELMFVLTRRGMLWGTSHIALGLVAAQLTRRDQKPPALEPDQTQHQGCT